MNVESRDDKIIKEIPVYLSDDLRQLLLLHYPTRLSKNDQLLTSTVTQCKYKTECEELELSYALDTDVNYDKAHGQELAAETEKYSKDKNYNSGMIDQLSFESHKTSSNTTDMIMFASGKSIHLCPLTKTLNMLPKLNHIDKIDPKNDHKKTSQNPNDVSEEEEEESEQIMAKFKDRPGKKSEKKKMQDMVKQRAMEPWINLNFVPNGQYFSRTELDKFMLPKLKKTNEDLIQKVTKNENYITDENIDPVKARQLSYNKIKSYSLENRIKIILFNTKMVSTKMLIDILQKCGVRANENVPTILTHLRKIAILIHGNWTIKSEELYPDNTISTHFGLTFEVMRFLRDYIIHLLDSDQFIDRSHIGKIFNAPTEEVKDALNSVAKLDENKTWKLLETSNDTFLETLDIYDEILKEQKDWLVTRVKQINTWLELKLKKN